MSKNTCILHNGKRKKKHIEFVIMLQFAVYLT